MCYFNRLTRVARWLADYPEWLQFCWDFMKPPRNDEIASQHFFSCLQQCKNFFFFFICAACNFFLPTSACRKFFFKITHPPPPQKLNGRPLIEFNPSSYLVPTESHCDMGHCFEHFSLDGTFNATLKFGRLASDDD